MIKYIPEGDKFRASQLWGEGRHQLSILKNAMSFGKLQQDQRLVHFADGTIIKCLSCFGQDVINIFVPQVFVGGEPEYREREEIRYYPSLEVYDSPYWGATYMGVVLCKGGGFNPPYEFAPKESLPADTHIQPLGKLPSERIWEPEVGRTLEDIVPKGIAGVDLVVADDPTPIITAPGEYLGLITRAEREWWESAQYVDCWEYWARAAAHYRYERTENYRQNYVFSYLLPGDAAYEHWPEYLFEGLLHKYDDKPTNTLNLSGTFYHDVQGSGNNNFYRHTKPTYYDIWKRAMKFIVDGYISGIPYGHWERDDENVNFTSIIANAIAQSESHFATYGDPADTEFPEFTSGAKRTMFFLGGTGQEYAYYSDYYYTYLDDSRRLWDYYGSVMDGNHYALAYSMMNAKKQVNYYREVSDITECILISGLPPVPAKCTEETEDIIINERTEGPLCVAVDGEIFELFPEAEPEVSPSLQGCELKYFRVGNKGIGLFRIAKNYYYPYDYIYVYAEVSRQSTEASKTNHIVTQVTTPTQGWYAHEIPDVTDSEGNPLYERGGLRLIKEETIIKEMATAEQPGLFRKIT